jgi:hypothetical protein
MALPAQQMPGRQIKAIQILVQAALLEDEHLLALLDNRVQVRFAECRVRRPLPVNHPAASRSAAVAINSSEY